MRVQATPISFLFLKQAFYLVYGSLGGVLHLVAHRLFASRHGRSKIVFQLSSAGGVGGIRIGLILLLCYLTRALAPMIEARDRRGFYRKCFLFCFVQNGFHFIFAKACCHSYLLNVHSVRIEQLHYIL